MYCSFVYFIPRSAIVADDPAPHDMALFCTKIFSISIFLCNKKKHYPVFFKLCLWSFFPIFIKHLHPCIHCCFICHCTIHLSLERNVICVASCCHFIYMVSAFLHHFLRSLRCHFYIACSAHILAFHF